MSERTIICKDCGESFTTHDTRRVYCDICSPRYRRNRRTTKPLVKPCGVCGILFADDSPGRNRRYCSRVCAGRAKHQLTRDHVARPDSDNTSCRACAQLAYCRSILWDVHEGPDGLTITPLPCADPGWAPLGPIMWAADPQPAEAAQQQEAQP